MLVQLILVEEAFKGVPLSQPNRCKAKTNEGTWVGPKEEDDSLQKLETIIPRESFRRSPLHRSADIPRHHLRWGSSSFLGRRSSSLGCCLRDSTSLYMKERISTFKTWLEGNKKRKRKRCPRFEANTMPLEQGRSSLKLGSVLLGSSLLKSHYERVMK